MLEGQSRIGTLAHVCDANIFNAMHLAQGAMLQGDAVEF